MSKRVFGIPVIGIIAIVAVLAIMGTAAIAAFYFTRGQPATVVIAGGGVEVYADAACTIPLGDTVELDFGEVRQEANSDTVEFWLKNIGTDDVYPVMSSDHNMNLALVEATFGTIGASPVLLYVPYSSTWTPSGITDTTTAALTTTVTYIHLASEWNPANSEPGVVKIDNELIYYEYFDNVAPNYGLQNCVRGYNGTTAAAHAAGATVNFGSLAIVEGSPLEPDAVLAVSLHLEADGDLLAYLGDTEAFTVLVEVTSDY